VRLAAALQTITAAVVGVIANLAVWFAIHTLFTRVENVTVFGGPIPRPVLSSVDWFAVAVAIVAFIGMQRFKWKLVPVVAASAIAGLIVNGLLR
jgi:chromate transporter